MAASTASMWFTSASFFVHSRTSASASLRCMLLAPVAVDLGEAAPGRGELFAQLGDLALGIGHHLEPVFDRPHPPPQRLDRVVELVQLVLELGDHVVRCSSLTR